MIITIDGPAGSGKSTAARKLAARLEIAYLDTGAMYRAVAFAAIQRGIPTRNEKALFELAGSLEMELDCGSTHTRVRVDGHDVSEAIRGMAVSAATSTIARHQGIRRLLVERQRRLGQTLGSFVSEGRDQGSTVFPEADVKFVLDAALGKRAERRHLELVAEGEDVTLDEVQANLLARDAVDTKQWDPLLAPGACVRIDTSDLTISQVVERMMETLLNRSLIDARHLHR